MASASQKRKCAQGLHTYREIQYTEAFHNAQLSKNKLKCIHCAHIKQPK